MRVRVDEVAQAEAYYAHRTNKFWSVLHEVGLTEAMIQPTEFAQLLLRAGDRDGPQQADD